MKKAICPITKDALDCKECKAIKNEKCPYFEFDKCIENALKFIRELVEREIKDE